MKREISDHHHMIYTMLKCGFQNTEPKLLNYRDYRNFSPEAFKGDLSEALTNCNTDSSMNLIFSALS